MDFWRARSKFSGRQRATLKVISDVRAEEFGTSESDDSRPGLLEAEEPSADLRPDGGDQSAERERERERKKEREKSH